MTEYELKEVKTYVKKTVNNLKDPQHGWKHLQRVTDYAERITKSVGAEVKVDIQLLLAACYLHDINRVYYPPTLTNYIFETRNSKSILPAVLNELNIKGSEKLTIENAIYSSSFSFPFKRLNRKGDLYTRILQDADTLDYFSTEREASFNKAKKDFRFYALLGLFSGWALNYGRNNLENYLNFPQIAKEDYVQKS